MNTRPAKTTSSILLICLAALITTLAIRFQLIDLFEYRIWGDRALSRAFFSENGLPHMGAELNFSGRVPGSALYVLLSGLQSLSHSPLLPYILQILMDIAALALVFLGTRRYCGGTAAAISATMYGLSIPIFEHLNELWNPGFIMLPSVLILFCSLRIIIDRQPKYFIPLLLIGGIAAQFHLSVYPFLIANLLTVFLFSWRIFSLRFFVFLALGVAALFLSQWNYWLFEIANGYPNLTLIFSNPTDSSRGWQTVFTNAYTLVRALSFLQNPLLGDATGIFGAARSIGIVLLNLLVLIAVFGAAVLMIRVEPRQKTAPDLPEFRQTMLMAIAMIGGLTIAIVSATALNAHFRYVLGAVAPACIFIGVGLGALVTRLDADGGNSAIGRAGRFLPVLFTAALITQSVDYCAHLPKRDLHTYSTLRDILGTVRDQFDLAGKEFRERVAFSHRIRDGRVTSFPPQTTFTYLTEVLFPPRPNAKSVEFCLFVTTPAGLSALGGDDTPVLSINGFDEAITVSNVLRRDAFAVIKYHTASGNCLKNTDNPFVYLNEVAAIQDNWQKAGTSEYLNTKAVNLDGLFVFRGALQGMFGGAVTLAHDNGKVRAKFASSNLRDDGSRVCPPGEWLPADIAPFDVWSFMARDPRIILVEAASGTKTPLPLHHGVLGIRTSGRLSPWQVEADLPKGSKFDVYFVADLRFRCLETFEPVEILLSKDHIFDPT